MAITLYTPDGYSEWVYSSAHGTEKKLVQTKPQTTYRLVVSRYPDGSAEVVGEDNWGGRLPIVPMWGSRLHQSTLVGMQQAIDSYDLIQSGFANDLTDVSQIYWILENYGGMRDSDLARLRDQLKVLHIATVDADQGGKVVPYQQEVPYQARQAYLDGIERRIYRDFGGLDVSALSSASKTATEIEAAYQPVDENASDFELQISSALQRLLALMGISDTPIFKRQRVSNQLEQVQMVAIEAQWIDRKTILSKLPNITSDEAQAILETLDASDLGYTRKLVDALAKDLVSADKKAAEHISKALPSIYAENYNFGSYQAHQASVVPSFALFDEHSVANLLDEDEALLPTLRVDIPKDMRWNASHIRSSLTQSFLAGEDIPHMAKRLQNVSNMNARSAVRIARTSITGAENRARADSYFAAHDIGINCEKQWMAALDGRTRDSHRALDGTHVALDKAFDNGCRFPKDPTAPAREVYNCRCTLVAYIAGHNTMSERNKRTVGSLSYEEWKRGVKEQQPEVASGRSFKKFLELPSVQKRMKSSGMSKRQLTDAMRKEMHS